MPRTALASLDAQRYAITQRALSGTSVSEILTWLHDKGVTASSSTLKRRLAAWRDQDDLPIGKPNANSEAVETAILEYLRSHRSQLRSYDAPAGKKAKFPSDEEIRDALSHRWRLSCRQVKDVRLRYQIRRRQKMNRFKPVEELVEAVLERCNAALGITISANNTTTISREDRDMSQDNNAGNNAADSCSNGSRDGSGTWQDPRITTITPSTLRELPKDDELAAEMRLLGFETCEKEIRAIRQKYGIKHTCRGANRHGQHRGILHNRPSPLASDDEAEGEEEEEAQDNEMDMMMGGDETRDEADEDESRATDDQLISPAVSKLIQDHHFTVVQLDAEATSIIRRIARPISKLIYDTVGSGVRQARDPLQVAKLAAELLNNLNVPLCTVSSMYISNHYVVPDGMFGIWIIPLLIHVESEGDEEERFKGQSRTHVEHLIDDQAVHVGQAIYLTKPAAVHTRLTALILSR